MNKQSKNLYSIGIASVSGNMGKHTLKAALKDSSISVSSGLVRDSNNLVGQDLGQIVGLQKYGITATHDVENFVRSASIVIDFSQSEMTKQILKNSVKLGKPLVICTNCLDNDVMEDINNASSSIPIFFAVNISYAMSVLSFFLVHFSEVFADYDLEIIEKNSAKKSESPTGASVMLARAASLGKKISRDEFSNFIKCGQRDAKRKKNEIGISSVKAGGIHEEHEVLFASEDESLSFVHKTYNNHLYSLKAIEIAKWMLNDISDPGIYGVFEFYNLRKIFSTQ